MLYSRTKRMQSRFVSIRFDDETKQSFLELYDKVDADFEITKELDVTKDEASMG